MQDLTSDLMAQAATLLVAKGYTREWAEELLRRQSYSAHPENAEAWVNQILGVKTGERNHTVRQEALEEHHRDGIPPYEPPQRD